MMSQPEALYNLQEIDLEILAHKRRIGEIETILQDDASISAARQQVDETLERLTPLQAQQRKLELQVQSNAQKAQTADDRLYSGKVNNPKELQDLQNEIASLKRRNDELETQMLELMMEIEVAEDDLATYKQQLDQVISASETENAELMSERSDLKVALGRLDDRRQQALGQVDPGSLQTYNELRKRKANQPIARLNDASCGTCGIELTQVVIQSVRHQDSFVECPNCGRILAVVN